MTLRPPDRAALQGHAAHFEAEGYCLWPDFIASSACAELLSCAEACLADMDLEAVDTVFDVRGQGHADDRWFLDSGGEVRAFLEDEAEPGQRRRVNKLGHALHEKLPAFRALSHDPRLAALVAALGNPEPLLLQSMLIFKYPRVGGVVLPHQDATYLYTEPASVIGLWLALEDATLDNGCLEVLPGSHRGPLRRRFRRQGERTWTEVLDARPWPREGWRPLPVSAGTLVAFHGLLGHRSAPNHSDRARRAYTLHVIDGRAHYADDNWLQRPADMPLHGFESPGA